MAHNLLAFAIVLMIGAYIAVFLWRGKITRKDNLFKTKINMAEDTAFITIAEKKKQEDFQKRLQDEKRDKEREEHEREEAIGEHTYPTLSSQKGTDNPQKE